MRETRLGIFNPEFYLNDEIDLSIRNETVMRIEMGVRARYFQALERRSWASAIIRGKFYFEVGE